MNWTHSANNSTTPKAPSGALQMCWMCAKHPRQFVLVGCLMSSCCFARKYLESSTDKPLMHQVLLI